MLVEVRCLGHDGLVDGPKYMTVAALSRLYGIGRHIMELKATLQHNDTTTTNAVKPNNDLHTCEICYTSNEKTQLPCGHSICEDCEERWVSRKLTCPFCRMRFGSAKMAALNGWNLTEFVPELLQRDLQIIHEELNATWSKAILSKKSNYTSRADERKRTLVALSPRLLERRETQDFGLIDA